MSNVRQAETTCIGILFVIPVIVVSVAIGLVARTSPMSIAEPGQTSFELGSERTAIDLNRDGVVDEVRIQTSDGSPRVVLSIRNRTMVLQPPIESSSFGNTLAAIGDIDGLGVDDLAIGAPEDFSKTDRVGRVYVFSSETGKLLHTLFGLRNEQFGRVVASAGDRDFDGFPDIAVSSHGVDSTGTAFQRRYIFSGSNGRRVFDRKENVESPQNAIERLSIVGDLDRDRDIDVDDLRLLLPQVGQSIDGDSAADVNNDGVVDSLDIDVLIDSFGGPIGFVEGGCPGGEEPCEDGFSCPPCDGDGSGTVGGGDDGGHGKPLGGGGGGGTGNPPPTPPTCQVLIEAPDELLYGELAEITAVEFPGIESPNIVWTVVDGSEHLASSGTTLDPTVFELMAGNQTGLATIQAEFQDETCEGLATATATVEIDECYLWLGGDPSQDLEIGHGRIITAHAKPEGGTFTWTPASLPNGIQFTPNGNQVLISSAISADSGEVAFIVEYTVNGCTRTQLGIFEFFHSPTNDADGDGLSDSDEVNVYGTDHLDADTDDDGFDDGCEVNTGFNPLDMADPGEDSSGIGQSECGCEIFLGQISGNPTYAADSDNDGLSDAIESCLGTDSTFFDTDGDGLADGFEHDNDFDALNPDSDGNGIGDGFEDTDGDGLNNLSEQAHGSDPNSSDTDGDGTSDGQEVSQGSFPNDDTDGGEIPENIVQVTLTIGDHSGSHSERWAINVGAVRLIAPFGDVISDTFPFTKGESHEITISHMGSTFSSPDYDYTATLSSGGGAIVIDEEGILGIHNEGDANFATGKSAKLIVAEDLMPDPETHVNDEVVTILPGDDEKVLLSDFLLSGADLSDPLFLVLTNPNTAKFVNGEQVDDSIPLAQVNEHVTLRGFKVGSSNIQVRIGSETGQLFMSLPVAVGGTVRIDYDGPATFKTGYSGPPAGDPAPPPGTPEGGSLPFGGSPAVENGVVSGAADARQPIAQDILEAYNDSPTRAASIRVEIHDPFGNPKPGKDVVLTTRYGKVEIASGQDPVKTDDQGRVEASIEVAATYDPASFGIPEQLWSFDHDRVAAVVGRTATNIPESFILPELDPVWNDQESQIHIFTGHSTRFEEPFSFEIPDEYRTITTFDFPLMNHGHLNALLDSMEIQVHIATDPDTGEIIDPTGSIVDLIQKGTGLPAPEVLADLGLYFDDEGFLADSFFQSIKAQLLQLPHDGAYIVELEQIDPSDPPVGGGVRLVTVSAIAGEFALGFVPGYDAIDIVKEGFWKPVVEGEEANYLLVGISFAALAADAGYIFGGAPGVVANAVTSIVKVTMRHVPESVVRALIRNGDTALEAIGVLRKYVERFPRPPETSVATWAKETTVSLINQWRKILYSPLSLDGDHIAAGLRVMTNRGARNYSDEAAEGVSAYIKHGLNGQGGEAAIDDVFVRIHAGAVDDAAIAAADDSVESVGEAIRNTLRNNPTGGAPGPTDLRRVDEAVAAARQPLTGSSRATAEGFIGPNNAIKSMEEFEALRFMRAQNLLPDQVTSINAIRDAVGFPILNSDVAKVTSFSDALNRITTSNPNLSGFFARQSDLVDANNAGALIDRLRLDYHASPFTAGESYAVIETKMSASLAGQTQIPRNAGYGGSYEGTFPYLGNGFAASKDGHLTPEWRMPNATPMDAEVTVISFKNADGSPQTVSLGGAGSSDRWVLRTDPGGPTGFVWESLP